MDNIKPILIEALNAGGEIHKKYYGNLETVEYKGEIDLVTQADKESEAAVISIIKKAFPTHQIIAEESGISENSSDYKWIIDPLDGTTNYAHSLPVFAVSIGIEYKGEIVAGGVYNSIREELFFAEKGAGAFLNNNKIKVSKVSSLNKSLLVTGFPYDRRENIDYYMSIYGTFLKKSHGVMRFGAAALDMCYVACGRLEGYWERNLYPWDMAAGQIILEEAGGKVTDFLGGNFSCFDKQLLCSNSLIHEQMVDVLKEFKHL